MTARIDREAAKRRIMFVPGEDFYFLTYTLLIILQNLGAHANDRPFHDSRKLSYLADILGSDADLRFAVTTAPLSVSARARLSLLYDRAVARRVAVERLVEALAKRRLIEITRTPGETDRIQLVPAQSTSDLLSNAAFEAEAARLKTLRSSLPQLRTMTLATLKKRLFTDHGVRTWDD